MALDQKTRMLALASPLGENQLLLKRIRGTEALSELFQFQLEMISENNAITAKDIVGKNVTVTIRVEDKEPRYWNGFVSRFGAGNEDEEGRREYRAEVMPWLWFLTRNMDCRIFQNKTVPAIVEQIFSDRGFTDFEFQLAGHHPTHEFVVQYRETDFQFISRLLEQEGVFYYFKHENGKHILVLGDHADAYDTCAENEVLLPRDMGSRALGPCVLHWEHTYQFVTGKIAQTDYNFKTPSTPLMTNTKTILDLPGVDKFEFYDYPGAYGVKDDGRELSDVRMESEEAGYDTVEGRGLCKTFTAGGKFTIQHLRSASESGKSYVLTRVEHDASEANPYETGDVQESVYENRFVCVPDAVVARPPRKTSPPQVHGVQTAVVVGPPGEEIYPDEFGRVKVQFHWDRLGQFDENSSCWVRVSQVHAGKGFGGIDLPRVGEEVIVSFEEGDVNRPIITGRVYHAENMPPFGLPDSKTVSGLKSKTYKGGGYNEYVMDDTPGNELIREHAQYNKDTTVENDKTLTVHNNRSSTIDVDDTEEVGNDQSVTVGSNQTINVGSNQDTTVGADQSNTVGGARSTSVSSTDELTVGSDQTINVGGSRSTNVGPGDTLTVGGPVDISASGAITITSGASITLIAGGSSIEIGPSGITLSSSGVITESAALVKHNA
jgi:type VI secretion system secreted protein VgrG